MLRRLMVSGADFRDTTGIISIIEITENGIELLREITIEHPHPKPSEKGKGITGLVFDANSNNVWANFSNVTVNIDLLDECIVEQISNDNFNDLHDLSLHNDKLISVNSGNESIDIIDCKSKEIQRIDLLSPDLQNRKPKVTMFSSTKPHLHHISSACYNAKNELIVGFFKQQRILNIDNWSQIGLRMNSPVHDIQIHGDEVYWTTVCGKVFSSFDEEPIINLEDYCDEIGWSRGLYLIDDYALIGTTALRDSNSKFYSVLTGKKPSGVGAKISMLDIKKKKLVSELELPNSQFRKVYSIIGFDAN